MATSYTTLQAALTQLQNACSSLAVQCSATAANSTALTSTYDASGNLIERVQALQNQLGLISQELARVNTSLVNS